MAPTLNDAEFTFKNDQVDLICPCMSLTLYLDLTDDSALVDFYDQSLKALEAHLTHVQAEAAKNRSPINARALKMVPTWIKNPRDNKNYFIEFSGGSNDEGISAARLTMSFEVNPVSKYPPERLARRRDNWRIMEKQTPDGVAVGLGLSELTVSFPLAHPLADSKALLGWIKNLGLVAKGPLVAGYCGFALNDDRSIGSSGLARQVGEALSSYSLRYPGFDWKSSVTRQLMKFRLDADDLIPMIKRVNWLSFVARRSVEYLGGIEKLRSSTGEDIVLHELPWGVIVQAGPAPQIGDVGHRDFVPAYRKAASLLRRIRLPKITSPQIGFTDEAANEWLNAFDRDYS